MPVIGLILGGLKSLFGAVLGLFRAMFEFATKNPWAAVTLVVVAISLFLGYKLNQTQDALAEAKTTIVSRDRYIKTQTVVLDQYVESLKQEQQVLANTIEMNNKAVASIKKEADKALAGAKAESLKAESVRIKYVQLADKYSKINSSTGTAEERITREQQTNDEFIADWNKIK